jgi:hypothetical protein
VLTTFGKHCAVPPSAATQMVLLHVAATVGLGLLVGVFEYLYVVGSSVVTWLRLFVAWAVAPAVALPWRHALVVVAQAVLHAPLIPRAPSRTSARPRHRTRRHRSRWPSTTFPPTMVAPSSSTRTPVTYAGH